MNGDHQMRQTLRGALFALPLLALVQPAFAQTEPEVQMTLL